jgi:hypothetical protein
VVADITGGATVVLDVLTLGVARIALWSASITRKALGSAKTDTVEAIKTRIDQQAPRVTAIALQLKSLEHGA